MRGWVRAAGRLQGSPAPQVSSSGASLPRVESVFFGGGTPSLASPHTVAAVLEAVAQAAHLPADSEVTLEVNPSSAPAPRLAEFGAAGVNRLSIGLQVSNLSSAPPRAPSPPGCLCTGHTHLLGRHLLIYSFFKNIYIFY